MKLLVTVTVVTLVSYDYHHDIVVALPMVIFLVLIIANFTLRHRTMKPYAGFVFRAFVS